MKQAAVLLIASMLLAPGAAIACGTHAPAVQARIDAAELAAGRALAATAARDADRILVGTVTQLARPAWGSGESGSVTFDVDEVLKGDAAASSVTVAWQDRFVYSCQPSAMFHNVGFRDGGRFIVYVRDGAVFRSAAADHLRSGLFALDEERATAAAGGAQGVDHGAGLVGVGAAAEAAEVDHHRGAGEQLGRALDALGHLGAEAPGIQRAHAQVGDADLAELQFAGLFIVEGAGRHAQVPVARVPARPGRARACSQGTSGRWLP